MSRSLRQSHAIHNTGADRLYRKLSIYRPSGGTPLSRGHVLGARSAVRFCVALLALGLSLHPTSARADGATDGKVYTLQECWQAALNNPLVVSRRRLEEERADL